MINMSSSWARHAGSILSHELAVVGNYVPWGLPMGNLWDETVYAGLDHVRFIDLDHHRADDSALHVVGVVPVVLE